MSSSSIQEILKHYGKHLETGLNLDCSTARIEVQCLLQTVLHVDRAWLLAHPEQTINDDQHARYMALFERRLRGEPIAYLLGEREFYGLTFKVSSATLIPRPETELLLDLALQRIPSPLSSPSRSGEKSPQSESGMAFRVLDMGTGSGAIALSIAHERPDVEVMAVDASIAALEVAQLNVQRLGLKNTKLQESDWFTLLHDERFDMIVSNPPYIASDDAHLTQGDVRFEPPDALTSGADGLDDIRRICTQAKAHLNPGGWLLFEHGHDQAERVRALLQQAGFTGVFTARDLAGIERVSGGS